MRERRQPRDARTIEKTIGTRTLTIFVSYFVYSPFVLCLCKRRVDSRCWCLNRKVPIFCTFFSVRRNSFRWRVPLLSCSDERKESAAGSNIRIKNFTHALLSYSYRYLKIYCARFIIYAQTVSSINQSSTLQTRQAFFPQPFARRREDLALEAFAVAFADDKLQLLAFPIGHFSTRA